ncbi:unnamed protein product [Peniophora sp. CBMAI 1063]|nr:unnamed protein product [Peniophora sp. CBMAI 1063]
MGQADVSDVLTSLAAALCAGRINDFRLPKSIGRSTWDDICAPWVKKRSIYCERMENVGDGVAGALVSALIYEKFPGAGAGVMTVMKQAAVSNVIFALILELTDPSIADVRTRYDELSVRARTSALLSWGTRICKEAYCEPARASIKALGDRFEALLGYLYVEIGYETALRWMNKMFDPLLDVAYTTVLARGYRGFSIPKPPRAPRAMLRSSLERGSSTDTLSEYEAVSVSSFSSQSLSSSSSSSPSRLFSVRNLSTTTVSSAPSSPILMSSPFSMRVSKRKERAEDIKESENRDPSNADEPPISGRLDAPRRKRRRSRKHSIPFQRADFDVPSESEGETRQFTFTFSVRGRSDPDSLPLPSSSSSLASATASVSRLSVVPLIRDIPTRRPRRQ